MRRMPIVSNWLERRGRSRVRRMMRGYRVLKATGRLDLFTEIGETLTNRPFRRTAATDARLIFGAATPQAAEVIRQYALVRVTRLTLNKSLLLALGRTGGRVVHPLPTEWRTVLEEFGFTIDHRRSSLAWGGYVFLLWGFGVLSIARRMYTHLTAGLRAGGGHEPTRYAYFDRLTADNLPQSAPDGRSFDILSWYAQWPGRAGALDGLCHNVSGQPATDAHGLRVRAMASPLPPLTAVSRQLRFAWWGLTATALAAVDMLRGRWWHALMLAEGSIAAAARLVEPRRLAQDYLFHVVGYLYRPLWTYEVEQQGARVILYNYSTNLETFKRADRYPTQAHSWHAITWPTYLVWDEGQADFFRRAVGPGADIRVVGPIWFSTSASPMPPLPARSVGVFDVQPHRASRYQVVGMADDYYTPRVANQFLLDAQAALQASGCTPVLKRKRHIGRLVHPHYAHLLRRLVESGHLLTVESEVPAARVIEQCDAVISMPFTATALLGRALGKPSIYYDPHGDVQQDDRAAHGIPIVTGRAALTRWISTCFTPDRSPLTD